MLLTVIVGYKITETTSLVDHCLVKMLQGQNLLQGRMLQVQKQQENSYLPNFYGLFINVESLSNLQRRMT